MAASVNNRNEPHGRLLLLWLLLIVADFASYLLHHVCDDAHCCTILISLLQSIENVEKILNIFLSEMHKHKQVIWLLVDYENHVVGRYYRYSNYSTFWILQYTSFCMKLFFSFCQQLHLVLAISVCCCSIILLLFAYAHFGPHRRIGKWTHGKIEKNCVRRAATSKIRSGKKEKWIIIMCVCATVEIVATFTIFFNI